MAKQLLMGFFLLSMALSARAQTPRPTFFEEERRLKTPTNQEIRTDRRLRQTQGFSETFLTDALNGIGDPGLGTESTRGFNASGIDPRNPNPPAPPLGIFTRPPGN